MQNAREREMVSWKKFIETGKTNKNNHLKANKHALENRIEFEGEVGVAGMLVNDLTELVVKIIQSNSEIPRELTVYWI